MDGRTLTIIVFITLFFAGLSTGFLIDDVSKNNTIVLKNDTSKTILCGVGYGELDKTPSWEPLDQKEILRLCS